MDNPQRKRKEKVQYVVKFANEYENIARLILQYFSLLNESVSVPTLISNERQIARIERKIFSTLQAFAEMKIVYRHKNMNVLAQPDADNWKNDQFYFSTDIYRQPSRMENITYSQVDQLVGSRLWPSMSQFNDLKKNLHAYQANAARLVYNPSDSKGVDEDLQRRLQMVNLRYALTEVLNMLMINYVAFMDEYKKPQETFRMDVVWKKMIMIAYHAYFARHFLKRIIAPANTGGIDREVLGILTREDDYDKQKVKWEEMEAGSDTRSDTLNTKKVKYGDEEIQKSYLGDPFMPSDSLDSSFLFNPEDRGTSSQMSGSLPQYYDPSSSQLPRIGAKDFWNFKTVARRLHKLAL